MKKKKGKKCSENSKNLAKFVATYFLLRDILRGGFRTIILETLILRYELKGRGHVPTFFGWFWVHAHNFSHVRPRSKNGARHQNLNQEDEHSIRLEKTSNLKTRTSKSDNK